MHCLCNDPWSVGLNHFHHDKIGFCVGVFETPMAYKNNEIVMASQQALVDVVAKFTPKMVRKADED